MAVPARREGEAVEYGEAAVQRMSQRNCRPAEKHVRIRVVLSGIPEVLLVTRRLYRQDG
jgi:hypothetical protein